jgi:hypothetical protein
VWWLAGVLWRPRSEPSTVVLRAVSRAILRCSGRKTCRGDGQTPKRCGEGLAEPRWVADCCAVAVLLMGSHRQRPGPQPRTAELTRLIRPQNPPRALRLRTHTDTQLHHSVQPPCGGLLRVAAAGGNIERPIARAPSHRAAQPQIAQSLGLLEIQRVQSCLVDRLCKKYLPGRPRAWPTAGDDKIGTISVTQNTMSKSNRPCLPRAARLAVALSPTSRLSFYPASFGTQRQAACCSHLHLWPLISEVRQMHPLFMYKTE